MNLTRSEFVEWMFGIKLNKFQKEYYDRKISKKLVFKMARRSGNRLSQYVMMDLFYQQYKEDLR